MVDEIRENKWIKNLVIVGKIVCVCVCECGAKTGAHHRLDCWLIIVCAWVCRPAWKINNRSAFTIRYIDCGCTIGGLLLWLRWRAYCICHGRTSYPRWPKIIYCTAHPFTREVNRFLCDSSDLWLSLIATIMSWSLTQTSSDTHMCWREYADVSTKIKTIAALSRPHLWIVADIGEKSTPIGAHLRSSTHQSIEFYRQLNRGPPSTMLAVFANKMC